MVTKKSWKALPTPARIAIIAVTAADAGLRAWALRDLAGRTSAEVNGYKPAWAIGLCLISSAGIVPALYLTRGRRYTRP